MGGPEPLLLYNDGVHERMTNEAKERTGPELEKRAAVLHKHRQFFGDKWFRYHLADMLLAYISSGRGKLRGIGYAIKRCGIVPIAAVMANKIGRHIRKLTWDRAKAPGSKA